MLTPELAGERIARPAFCPPAAEAVALFDESMCPGLDDCLQATCFNCLDHPEAADCPNNAAVARRRGEQVARRT